MAIALVEPFHNPGGWIRVWFDDNAIFGQPYNYHIGYEIIDGFARLKGFNRKIPPPSEFEIVIKAINKTTGYLVSYDRYNSEPPMRSVQINPGLIGGRIRMTKISIPHTDEVKTYDGSINHTLMDQHIEIVREAVRRGQLKIVTLGETAVKNEQNLPDLDDLLNNDLLMQGDKIFIFCVRGIETGPGRQENHPPRN